MPDRDRAHRTGRDVHGGQCVGKLIGDVECPAVGGHGEPGGEQVHLLAGRVGRRQRQRRLLCEPAVAVHGVHPDLVVAARAGVGARAVRAVCHADEQGLRGGVREGLFDLGVVFVGDVEYLQRLHALAVVGDEQVPAVGAQRRAERQAAEGGLPAGRRDLETDRVTAVPSPRGPARSRPVAAAAVVNVSTRPAATLVVTHNLRTAALLPSRIRAAQRSPLRRATRTARAGSSLMRPSTPRSMTCCMVASSLMV